MSYETAFLVALGITVVSEIVVLLACVRWLYRLPPASLSTGNCLAAGLLASCATLPYLWFVLPALLEDFLLRTILGELIVVLVETMIYILVLRLSFARALVVSVAANAVSIAVGLAVLPRVGTGY